MHDPLREMLKDLKTQVLELKVQVNELHKSLEGKDGIRVQMERIATNQRWTMHTMLVSLTSLVTAACAWLRHGN